MAIKWIKTNHTGLRYYEHKKRKVGKQRDRYYSIRFRLDGKLYEYGIGWLSDGVPAVVREKEPDLGFQEYCLRQLREYKGNTRIGEGPKSPKEKRQIAEKIDSENQAELERQAKESLTFKYVFEKIYGPVSKSNKKAQALQTEESLFKKWIEPVIGELPLKDIAPIDLERIKQDMKKENRAARTIAYALSLIRQVYNYANTANLYAGKWPGANKAVRIPKEDNRRQRYLTHAEAKKLLDGLGQISPDVRDMALLSLHCGLRAGEIFALTWADIDMEKGTIFIRDPKSGRNRHAYMTADVKAMLDTHVKGKKSDLIFIRRWSKNDQAEDQGNDETVNRLATRISKTFNRVVANMELNKDIADRRQKVVFHSLRHTYASWLVESGVSLYTVQKLLGHEDITMTQRYAHLSPDNLAGAVRILEAGIEKSAQEKTEQVDPASQVS